MWFSTEQKAQTVFRVFLVLTCSITFYLSIVYPKPVGADIVFHLNVVDAYLHGQIGMFAENVMTINHIPYPPLFHLVLLPFVYLGLGNLFIRFLQALLYPLCVYGAMVLAFKHGNGLIHALTTGTALLGCMAFTDLCLQVRPESLDAILWLLMVELLLANNVKGAIATAVLGVYNHSFASLAFNGGAFLGLKRWKPIAIIAIASSPIIAVSLYYLASFWSAWYGTPASPQAYQFMHNFLAFTLFYLGSLVFAIPASLYLLFCKPLDTLTRLDKTCLLTLGSSLVMIPIWYDRFYQYASLPLALLLGSWMSKSKKALTLLPIIVLYAMLFYANLWLSNLTGAWDFH